MMYKIGDIVIRTHIRPTNWVREKAEIVGNRSLSGNWLVRIISTGQTVRWDPDFFTIAETGETKIKWEV